MSERFNLSVLRDMQTALLRLILYAIQDVACQSSGEFDRLDRIGHLVKLARSAGQPFHKWEHDLTALVRPDDLSDLEKTVMRVKQGESLESLSKIRDAVMQQATKDARLKVERNRPK